MRKIFLLLILFTSVNLSAQENSNKKFIYCEIVGTGKMFSNKVTIEMDFGQATKFFSNDKRLKDENGKAIAFNSMVDAMNWMGNNGWEFLQAYVVTTSNQNVYHWLLKKDTSKLSDEEIEELKSSLEKK